MIIPASILAILQGFELAMAAAPKVVELVKQAKKFFADLFSAGLITKAQQDAVFLRIEAHWAMVQAGIVPQHWQVEPDPTA